MSPLTSFLLIITFGILGTPSRRWPDGNGGFVRGSLVLDRTDDLIVMVSDTPRLYRTIPKSALRDLDRKYLARLEGRPVSIKDQQGVPDEIKKIAVIEDGASLLDACSTFHSMDKKQILECFRKYLSLCEKDNRFHPDNIWFIGSMVFERPSPPYPDFLDPSLHLTAASWPTSSCTNFEILGDLPFFRPIQFGHSGPCWPDVDLLVSWLDRHGKKKTHWPRSISLPTDTLNQLEDNTVLRRQAWRMVSHLFDMEWDLVFEQPVNDERWKKLSEMLTQLEVKWDSHSFKFTTEGKVIIGRPPVEWLPTTLIQNRKY